MRMATWLRDACLATTLALLLSACDSAASQSTATVTAKTPIASIAPPTLVSCPSVKEYAHNEAQGVVRSTSGVIAEGQLWVWIQTLAHIQGGEADYAQGKFVWRMTGQGDFHVLALGPHGEQLAPKDGPVAHSGSTWSTHPGDEWGTIMTFSSAGCWDLHVWRDDIAGDVALRIE